MASGAPAVNKENWRPRILLRRFWDPVKIKPERCGDNFKKQTQRFDNNAFKNRKKPDTFSPLAFIGFGSKIDRIIPYGNI